MFSEERRSKVSVKGMKGNSRVPARWVAKTIVDGKIRKGL